MLRVRGIGEFAHDQRIVAMDGNFACGVCSTCTCRLCRLAQDQRVAFDRDLGFATVQADLRQQGLGINMPWELPIWRILTCMEVPMNFVTTMLFRLRDGIKNDRGG